MHAQVKRRLDRIGTLAHGDEKYKDLVKRCCILEKEIDRLVASLPPEQGKLIWEFALLSAEKTQRLLEIACEEMAFPPKPPNR